MSSGTVMAAAYIQTRGTSVPLHPLLTLLEAYNRTLNPKLWYIFTRSHHNMDFGIMM